ncbi:beta-glucuronidase [Escherichia coli]|uniref:beta-glucuronidase n=1 Tax=Escherichia coli TaxID=562 RepID=UPI000707B511|nr:beta-glucuronidase [Escherichia coli]EEV5623194.1 beta-glucuronidase [Escherichia coli]EFD0581873.1 beta-glucuronidase [Escherichia coli]KQC27754.1 beta-glucuronidase [Escherichia coli]MWM72250.1 beta-glucuronidase [Escherichia coli]MWS90484.1 beta-glucuronidase [Escherichia coli]
MSVFLFPQESATRRVKDINGIWRFKIDKNNEGRHQNWARGLTDTTDMAVPSSYNDIFTEKEHRDHCGDVWYETEVIIPKEWEDKDIFVRFGSVTHQATVWVNGTEVVSHVGGYLPFAGLLNGIVRFNDKNKIVVVVNNELSRTTLPCGHVNEYEDGTREVKPWFDFFNYAGIHRPVKLLALPKYRITDITVVTDFEETTGKIDYTIEARVPDNARVHVTLYDAKGNPVSRNEGTSGQLLIKNVRLWKPGEGYLYTLEAIIRSDDYLIDQYSLETGIRTVRIEGNKFLINNEPFYFKGFGKHEDSEYRGRGYDPVVNLRDFELLKWINANSIRTSHYPYAEEFMQLANRRGLVVIDEVSAVGQFDMMNGGGGISALGAGISSTTEKVKFFDNEDVRTDGLATHKQAIEELFRRDKNHPCVVMWSLANEPDTTQEASGEYFRQVFEYARSQDPQNRPLTFVNVMLASYGKCCAHQYADVICLNRYYGWYSMGGLEMRYASGALSKELAGWASEGKPVLITEYGADTVAGVHKLPSVQWSEEYQLEYLEQQHIAFDSCDAIIGEQMWNFADFQTWEGIIRMDGNKKGAFTRNRQPKMSAHYLKKRWSQIPDFHYKKNR